MIAAEFQDRAEAAREAALKANHAVTAAALASLDDGRSHGALRSIREEGRDERDSASGSRDRSHRPARSDDGSSSRTSPGRSGTQPQPAHARGSFAAAAAAIGDDAASDAAWAASLAATGSQAEAEAAAADERAKAARLEHEAATEGLTIVVPANAQGGDAIEVSLRGGRLARITLPSHAVPGTTLDVRVPKPPPPPGRAPPKPGAAGDQERASLNPFAAADDEAVTPPASSMDKGPKGGGPVATSILGPALFVGDSDAADFLVANDFILFLRMQARGVAPNACSSHSCSAHS